MIAFASCVGSPETFATCAAPGLRLVMEPDSVLAELTTANSIHHAYNEALEHFAGYEHLEALVLLHEDVELLADVGLDGSDTPDILGIARDADDIGDLRRGVGSIAAAR